MEGRQHDKASSTAREPKLLQPGAGWCLRNKPDMYARQREEARCEEQEPMLLRPGAGWHLCDVSSWPSQLDRLPLLLPLPNK